MCSVSCANVYNRHMDIVGGLLSSTKAQRAFLLRSMLDPPFSLRIQDHAPLTVVAMLRGSAWVIPDGAEAALLSEGDIGLVRGPDEYTVADSPDTHPMVFIDEDQNCTTADGQHLAQSMNLGVRTWGDSTAASTVMLTGTYVMDTAVSRTLLDALPMLIRLQDGEWDTSLVKVLEAEVLKDEPGQSVVLDRLLDALVVTAIRSWFTISGDGPGWFAAHSQPGIGAAIRSMQDEPAHAWTVAELARQAGMSRAAFSRQFTERVGEPPMTFLTNWRLTLAADLLCEPGTTIAAVAEQVGYGSPYALSAAFKRVRGISPKQHRTARLAS